jgi:hypothetical protein
VPIPSQLGGKVEPTITDEDRQCLRDRMNQHPLSGVLGADAVSDAAVDEFIKNQKCTFVAAILVETGALPPQFELGADKGDTVYYHEGSGHQIGEYTVIGIEQIIAWGDGKG